MAFILIGIFIVIPLIIWGMNLSESVRQTKLLLMSFEEKFEDISNALDLLKEKVDELELKVDDIHDTIPPEPKSFIEEDF